MRFHVISLPHTQTTEDFCICAYTEKVRKFCKMMQALGHTVYLYAGEHNEAPCYEHISCITEDQRKEAVGDSPYVNFPFDVTNPTWSGFNSNVITALSTRLEKEDFICLIAGLCHKPIADAYPKHMSVEFGIGYSGVFAPYKVFESYAWMHTMYGQLYGASQADGQWYDTVINGYLEIERFPFKEHKEDYFLFVGRLIDRKGYKIASDVCKRMGARLILAGQGSTPDYGEAIGPVGIQRRNELMAGAKALFVPTLFLEPFGNVAVEAMACGTPVICSDWGAMTETVLQGKTGFRCRTEKEFCDATQKVDALDKKLIRKHAEDNYSLDVIGLKYQKYFERLLTLWDKGWYT
jgi:glycosyl transferase family 1